MRLEDTRNTYMETYVVSKVSWSHSVLSSQDGLFTKWVAVHRKGLKVGTLGALVTHILGTFNLIGFKVILFGY